MCSSHTSHGTGAGSSDSFRAEGGKVPRTFSPPMGARSAPLRWIRASHLNPLWLLLPRREVAHKLSAAQHTLLRHEEALHDAARARHDIAAPRACSRSSSCLVQILSLSRLRASLSRASPAAQQYSRARAPHRASPRARAPTAGMRWTWRRRRSRQQTTRPRKPPVRRAACSCHTDPAAPLEGSVASFLLLGALVSVAAALSTPSRPCWLI